MWYEPGVGGNLVYKFDLQRLEGQQMLPAPVISQSLSESASIKGGPSSFKGKGSPSLEPQAMTLHLSRERILHPSRGEQQTCKAVSAMVSQAKGKRYWKKGPRSPEFLVMLKFFFLSLRQQFKWSWAL